VCNLFTFMLSKFHTILWSVYIFYSVAQFNDCNNFSLCKCFFFSTFVNSPLCCEIGLWSCRFNFNPDKAIGLLGWPWPSRLWGASKEWMQVMWKTRFVVLVTDCLFEYRAPAMFTSPAKLFEKVYTSRNCLMGLGFFS